MAKVDFPTQVPATNPDWLLGANATSPAKTPIQAPGRALLAAPTDADQRTVLGLGTAATEDTQDIIDAAVAQASVGGNGTTYLASFGDATPVTIFSLPAAAALDSIDVEVLQTWDGVGAAVRIGVAGDPGRYFAASDTDLTELASFSKAFTALGPATIIITLTPGIGASQGQVRVQISTTPVGT